jgi:parvulin-like peptidyl-prolyl isomerase
MKVKQTFLAAIAATALVTPTIDAATPDAMTSATTNSSDSMTALFGDPAVATGTGFEVKRSDLDAVLTGIKSAAQARGQAIPPEQMTRLEANMLERLIDIQLLLQKANAEDKATGVKKANTAMATLLEKAGSQETLDMQLKAAGTTESDLRNKVTQEATAMAALQRELGVTISDADIQKFYDSHPSDFEQPDMVHVRHILFMTIDPTTHEPLSDDTVQAKRKAADDVLKRIHSGEDFSKLAQQYSEDPTTKDKGGELPAFPHGQMVAEFDAAAFSLTNNQVSDVIKTQYGYHIIKLIDRTPAKKLALTDVVPGTVPPSTVSDRIKDYLTQQKTDELAQPYLEKLKKADDVKILDPDLNAAMQAMAALAKSTNAVPTEK